MSDDRDIKAEIEAELAAVQAQAEVDLREMRVRCCKCWAYGDFFYQGEGRGTIMWRRPTAHYYEAWDRVKCPKLPTLCLRCAAVP